MGVDCSAVSGFGVLLTQDELDAAFKQLGIEFDHDEGYLELCDHYGLPEPKQMGTYYATRGVEYLYCAKRTTDPETGDTKSDPEQVATLKRMAQELGVEGPMFHEGELWH